MMGFGAAIVLAIVGYLFMRGIVNNSGSGGSRISGTQETGQAVRTEMKESLSKEESDRNASDTMPQILEIISDKWKTKEKWAENMVADRPEKYQKSLDEEAPEDLKFGAAIRLRLIKEKDGARLSYLDDKNQVSVKVDGMSSNIKQYAYGRRGNMIIIGFPDREEASRIVHLNNETAGKTAATLPKFNYHEKRRWYIDGWAWISEKELLGLSHEEDGKSEGIVKSHFYYYDMKSKTLCTLVLPDEVDPYQAIDFHGMNPETGIMKISDEQGNVFYLRMGSGDR
jgi:hypothetical protein